MSSFSLSSESVLPRKARRGSPDFYLQITSLIDTLVIILIFMLMTLASGGVNLEMASRIRLPWVSKGAEPTQGVKLVAREDGIYLDERKLVSLEKLAPPASALGENGRKIIPVFEVLAPMASASAAAAQRSGVRFEGRILLQADRSIPLATIREILYTAARAGYNDFRFAVIRK